MTNNTEKIKMYEKDIREAITAVYKDKRRFREKCPHRDNSGKLCLICLDKRSPLSDTHLFLCTLCGAELDISKKIGKITIVD